MTQENKITRREWFRLGGREKSRTRQETPDPSHADSMGDSPKGLQPIEHPVNHDGMDLSKLPPMREAVLTEDDVRQLFSDIAALAADVLLMTRSTRTARASASKATTTDQLRSALDSLLSGAIPRLQIRYHWQQQNWIDTLERHEKGYRLIRIAHTPQEG